MRFERKGPFHWVAEPGYTICVTLSGPGEPVWAAWAPPEPGKPTVRSRLLGCCSTKAQAIALCYDDASGQAGAAGR